MIETIARGTRRTRRPHRCFDCYRTIPAGTVVEFFTGKYDEIYTLYFHQDCRAAADYYRANAYWADYQDGTPPLCEDIEDNGEWDRTLADLRGRFPHVVCRLEYPRQIAAMKRGETETI